MKRNNENIKRRVPAPSSSELTRHAVDVLRVGLEAWSVMCVSLPYFEENEYHD